ncbi:hypothetical protein KFL_007930020 [Klebsormidium nitens]|uniref:Pirin C-terminal domain-containing protein n=1 Tax=Klebsormidium nitens TaxID=105231 RepID=A0A1Y1IPR2_KLENI|nr:hypothetical protein KFL_007930020 [Klebsormidium nitens]|eukprot:GAQ91479.1 hypothetical protein KFL_007930020 [Klebsormidium nitens]
MTVNSQRQVERVLTAARIGDEGAVRIIGPGTDLPQGFGPFLSLDEFFLAPSPALSSPYTPPLLESLVYFLEPPQPEPSHSNHPADDLPPPPETSDRSIAPETSDEIDQPRHGLQLFLRSALQPVVEKAVGDGEDGGSELHWPIVNHGREAEFVAEAGAGGGQVKVVAGGYGGVWSGPPLDGFQLLDVSMGPDCRLEIPLHSKAGALVYILEGVGLFGGETAGFASASYQNEGHALWLPAHGSTGVEQDSLLVRTNRMSGVRFIFLAETSPHNSVD